jgi:hypothetical protein
LLKAQTCSILALVFYFYELKLVEKTLNSNLFSCKTTLETSKRSAAQNKIKGIILWLSWAVTMFQQINSSPHLPAFLKNYTNKAFREYAVENASKDDNVGLKSFKNLSIAPCELFPRKLPTQPASG